MERYLQIRCSFVKIAHFSKLVRHRQYLINLINEYATYLALQLYPRVINKNKFNTINFHIFIFLPNCYLPRTPAKLSNLMACQYLRMRQAAGL